MRVFCFAVALIFVMCSLQQSSEAARKGLLFAGFGKSVFALVDTSQPGGFQMVKDPIDFANEAPVLKFTIKPAKCRKGIIDGNDCDQQSARSVIAEDTIVKQPKEAWYGWEMLFPDDFPIGADQTNGFQMFNEWKDNFTCGQAGFTHDTYLGHTTLNFVRQKPTGKSFRDIEHDCKHTYNVPIAEIKDLKGKWQRFEFFARWTNKDDGRYIVYLNGVKVMDYTGKTCVTSCRKMNYHLIGNYLCCTPDTKQIVESTVYYKSVSRAKTREGLKWN